MILRGKSVYFTCAKRDKSNGGDSPPPLPLGLSRGAIRNATLVAFLCGPTAFLSSIRKEMGWKEYQWAACTLPLYAFISSTNKTPSICSMRPITSW